MAQKNEEKHLAVTFYTKQKIKCPVCDFLFQREELLSGGGRLIAGDLTDELHRTYVPSAKYGTVYPLIYSVVVCPNCYFSLLPADFNAFEDEELAQTFRFTIDERKKSLQAVFPNANFNKDRTLLEGCASYYLALLCYDKLPAVYSPTIRKAMICLRLAWLSKDMNSVFPGKNYDFVSSVFYKKANFFYSEALNLEMERKENITEIGSMGPDIDKNYGYDGVVYLACLLEYKYGQTTDIALRMKKLSQNKSAIAKIFGLGKASKAKPGPLLEHSRNLYDQLKEAVKDAHSVGVEISDDD